MGLPGHRRTSSDKRKRAAHFALAEMNINECQKCKKPSLPHKACGFCGTYKNRQVINTDKRMARSKRHATAKK